MRQHGGRRVSMRVYIAGTVALAVLISTLAVTFLAYGIQTRLTRNRFYVASATSAVAEVAQLDVVARQQGPAAVTRQAASVAQAVLFYGYGVVDRATPREAELCGGINGCLHLPEAARTAVSQGDAYHVFTELDDTPVFLYTQPIAGTRLQLLAVYDYSQQVTDLQNLRRDLLIVDAIGVAVAVAMGIAVSLTLSRPVRRAATAARHFSGGALDVRMPVRGGSELADLAEAFNSMAARLTVTLSDLHAAQTLQQRFVADVSHELRTPLSAMVAAAGVTETGDAGTRDAATATLRTSTTRMHRLVEDLLEISRFDAGQAALSLEPVDLAELCRDVIDVVAADRADEVNISSIGDAVALVDARRMHTVLRNLVGNALRHGAPPVDVIIDAGDPQTVSLSVSDHGPGVPEELMATVFDRFVRGERARTSDGTNTGLGLAIAQENVRLHHGSLTLDTRERTAFVLRLPRESPAVRL